MVRFILAFAAVTVVAAPVMLPATASATPHPRCGDAEVSSPFLLDPTVQGEILHLPNANRSWITHYMYSLGIAIAGGSANVQRNVIAERGLGLPRDWWAQRSSAR